jgi:predicted nucleotidyltransferase
MYFEPLTKTSIEILAHLSSKIRESFTVRQIAHSIGRDYKITYIMTMRLAKTNYVIAQKKRPVTNCKLNLKANSSLLTYIEAIRASRFFAKHRDLEILTNEIISKLTSPFVIMILFGSYIKGTVTDRSDLDILFIVPNRTFENTISSAVGSVQHISPIGIHEVMLTNDEFMELLEQKTTNIAWEAVDNHIVSYGGEAYFKMLETIL